MENSQKLEGFHGTNKTKTQKERTMPTRKEDGLFWVQACQDVHAAAAGLV